MNEFPNKSNSDGVVGKENFEKLSKQVLTDPSILFTMSLDTLLQFKDYLEEECKKREEKLAELKAGFAAYRFKSDREGDLT